MGTEQQDKFYKKDEEKKTRRSCFNLCYGIFVMAVGCVLRGTDG